MDIFYRVYVYTCGGGHIGAVPKKKIELLTVDAVHELHQQNPVPRNLK